ncbi:MAG: flavodoxin [Haloplasmataceae bacterium]|jgi:menaquinone-dependent protoporphyrinogen oxidase|nr:flavodoxin [Haloplasmataceae bacterium]
MTTLILYASKYGCAEKCAKLLQAKLNGEAVLCNIKDAHQKDLSQFDIVIIGGSIYMGRIQKQIRYYCENNLNTLSKKKLGLFIICLKNGEEAQQELEVAFPKELFEIAIVKDYFGGEIIYKNLNFLERLMTNMVSKSKGANFPILDENKNISNIKLDHIERFISMMNK